MGARFPVGLCLLALAASLPADMQWTGAGENANWGNPDNWDIGVPGTGDRAYFTAASPATTSVNVDADYTLERDDPALLLNFNNANSYTFSGPGSLTFRSESEDPRNMINIAAGAKDTTQTFNMDLIFDTASNQRISTAADAHVVFNGNLIAKQTFNIRLNDLNSSVTFHGNVLLENHSVLQLYGGTIRFNTASPPPPDTVVLGKGSGIVVMQGQGRDVLVILDNTTGPVFDSSLNRIHMGVAEGFDTTIRMEAENQVATDVWLRVALWDLNGFDNRNTGALRLSTDGDSGALRFGKGESLWFSDSSGQNWADAVVDLIDFEFGRDEIRFGTDANGLTRQQLGQIRIDGKEVDGLMLNSEGFLRLSASWPGMVSVADAGELKAHILEMRGPPLTDLEVKTVIRVADYGALPDTGENAWPAIRQALNAAGSAEKPVLVLFEKGRYYADREGTDQNAVLNIRHMDNVIVDGQGAEMIIQSPYLHFSDVRDSENIIIRNFEIDYDPLPFSQGTVVAVDAAAGAFEIEVDAGFPAPDEEFFSAAESWGMLKDPAVPGRLKPGSVPFYRRTECVPVGENRFRIAIERTGRIAHFEVGDRYAQVGRVSRLGGFFGSDQVTFMNLTAYSCPGGLFVGSRTSRLNVLNCRSILKEGRLLTTGADGVHVQSARLGPWVEGCHFEGLSDDGSNFYSPPNHILDVVDSHTLEMERIAFLVPGDRLAFFHPESGRILSVNTIAAINGSQVIFEEDLPEFDNLAPPGTPYDSREWRIYDHAYNLDATGNYFVFRNNTVRDGRRYGSYFKASYGLISGNHFEGVSHAGIVLWNEPGWPEGFYSRNVIVAENTVVDCALMDSAAVKIDFKNLGAYNPDAGRQGNFYLYRNRIENPHGPALEMSRTDGATFAANRFVPGPGTDRGVFLRDVRIRPDAESLAAAEDFDLPDGQVTDPVEVPLLLGPDWMSAAGSQWQVADQELVMSGTAHVANRDAQTSNSGEGDGFIASATLRLNTTASSAWAGLVFNYDEGSGQFLAFRFNGEGQAQLIRPDGTAQLNTSGFEHIQNRLYRLTAASFQPHAYYLEVKDTVTGEVLYSNTVANSQPGSNGLSDGIAGLFSGTSAAAFQEFRVWNSVSEPVFTSVRGVPLAWYAAQGITPQSEGVSTWEELDEIDSTGQGIANWRVYAGGTDPSDPSAHFGIRSLEPDGAGRLRLEWRGGTRGASGPYAVEYRERLDSGEPWRLLGIQERVDGSNEWTGDAPPGKKGFFRIRADSSRF